jgi:hypothetical protein
MAKNPFSINQQETKRPYFIEILEYLNYRNALRIICSVSLLSIIHFLLGIPFPKIHLSQFGLLWAATASVIVMQSTVGNSYQIALKRIYGVGIGCIVSMVILGLNGYGLVSTIISILFTVSLCSVFKIKDSSRIASISALTLTLNGSSLLTSGLPYYIVCVMRFGETIVGILVGLVITHTVFPEYALENLHKNSVKILKRLHDLIQIISWYHISTIKFDADSLLRENLKEIYALFDENINNKKNIQMEISLSDHSGENLFLITDHLENILYSTNQIYYVYKKELFAKVVSKSEDKFSALFNYIESRMIVLSAMLNSNSDLNDHPLMNNPLEQLHTQISEYQKQMRSTISSDDEESLFIFFFHIKQVVLELDKIEKCIRDNNVVLSS